MQQRSEPHDSLDDFPTPPWATRALCERIIPKGCGWTAPSVREPAANRGHMVRPLREFFKIVDASDVHDYGAGFPVRDFLFGPAEDFAPVDWTITNPPFRLAEQFIARGLETSDHGVAMLVRSAFLEGIGRFERLFSVTPPTEILQFSERVVMHKGRLAPEGSTATAYAWVVWRQPHIGEGTAFHWIPPCRRELEREDDYPADQDAPGVVAVHLETIFDRQDEGSVA